MKLLLLVLLLLVAIPAFTQQDSVKITTPGDTVVVTETWTVRQLKQFARQQRRDSTEPQGVPARSEICRGRDSQRRDEGRHLVRV